MRVFRFMLIILLCGVAQLTVLNSFRIFNLKPDLLLLSAILASLLFRPRGAIFLSAFAGMLKDIFGTNPFGMNISLFCLWSVLIIFLSREIPLEDEYIRLGLVLIVAFIHNIAEGAVLAYSGNFIPAGIFLRIVFIGSVYTAVLFWLLIKLPIPLLSTDRLRYKK